MKYRFGIDLGGTKIEGIVLPESAVEPLARMRVPTESDKGYEHVLAQVEKLVRTLETQTGIKALRLGIGTPGAIDPHTGTLKNCNAVSLIGKPFHTDLAHRLGISVRMANDANCFALAETHYGVVKRIKPDAKVVFGVIMGSGVGGGIVVNGQTLDGCHGIAGEWGHNFLDTSGGPCYCGRTGCVETVISGKGLERWYAAKSGNTLSLPQIVELAATGTSALAQEALNRLHAFFGKAIAHVINILDPDVIVLGGGVGNIESLYTEGRKHILPHLFNPRLDTLIVKPELGDSAGVYGAAALAG